MRISITNQPIQDKEGALTKGITIIVSSDAPSETAKDVLESYQTIIKGLEERNND